MSFILVAEDDPYIQLLITRKLQNAGFEVRSATNGNEALTVAVRDVPKLLLLDVMLPDRNGLDVCREVKRQLEGKAPPVIIISARGQLADVDAAKQAGADDYLIKPFAPSDLLAHVQKLMAR